MTSETHIYSDFHLKILVTLNAYTVLHFLIDSAFALSLLPIVSINLYTNFQLYFSASFDTILI